MQVIGKERLHLLIGMHRLATATVHKHVERQLYHGICLGCKQLSLPNKCQRAAKFRSGHFTNKFRWKAARFQSLFIGVTARTLCTQEGKPAEPSPITKSSENVDDRKTIVKVVPTIKTQRPKIDVTKPHVENLFMTPIRAMNEYLLTSQHLYELPSTKRRSPYSDKQIITVYLRKDVENKCIEVWGSLENMLVEKNKRQRMQELANRDIFKMKKAWREYEREHEESKKKEKSYIFFADRNLRQQQETIFKSGSGKVVLSAIGINLFNCLIKFIAWMYSGSHSMFAEFLHSSADTANQVVLAIGLHQSLKQADTEHPYGWTNFRYITSLISGVGIFCVGAGLSWYHGVHGLLNPQMLESLYWGIATLVGSFLSEGATLLIAINQVRKSAAKEKMTFLEYVVRGMDPSVNVVLLEDFAAVVGVTIAASCMGITYYTTNTVADAVGSLLVGTLLGGVAAFIMKTNISALVGRSIPSDKRLEIMKELESDRLVRALHDVKATDIGSSQVRFKAEVDFDGRELTKLYLEKQDLESLMKDMNAVENIEDVEAFMLKHGEKIVDTLGGEVDRIEKDLKRRHPEVRHVDLEQL